MATTKGEDVARRAWGVADGVALVGLTLIAGILRFIDLGNPRSLVFDEIYYARDACLYLEASEKVCGAAVESGAHPPLGKWLLAAGIKVFGFDSFGWRFAAAAAGTFSVVLLYLLARKLLSSVLGASLTAGLLAFDPLHFVQSRVAMLDVFVPLFGIAAVLFIVYDRDTLRAPRTEDSNGETPPAKEAARWRWRAAAGGAAGAAFACKWSGGSFVLMVVALAAVWEVAARRQGASLREAVAGAVRGAGPSIALWLVVVPALVYIAAYAGRLDGGLLVVPWSEDSWARAFFHQQDYMLDVHTGLAATHHYQSPAWTWIVVRRPVSYFFETTQAGDYQEILALGNPFVWWSSIIAIAFVAYRWLRARDFKGPEGTILAGVTLTYGPWLAQPTGRPAVFLFYLLPTVPFMCLALGYVAAHIAPSWEGRAAAGLFGAVSIWLFAFFHPLLVKDPIPREQWERRIWFDDCTSPGPREISTTIVETTRRATVTRTKTRGKEKDPPPEGWCWI